MCTTQISNLLFSCKSTMNSPTCNHKHAKSYRTYIETSKLYKIHQLVSFRIIKRSLKECWRIRTSEAI
ncbi:hypothetical protein Hanom_Chr04g00372211 [Helianthus anomalus]